MFKPLYMGTNHMLGQDAYVPVNEWNFEIRVYNMDGTTPDEYSDVLTLTTKSIDEISEDQQEIEVHYANGVVKYPGKVTYGDVNWTLNCFTSPNSLEALRAWRAKCYNTITEAMGKPSDYMRQVYFIKYGGAGEVLDVIKCPGTWIKDLSNGAMNQEGNLVEVKVNLVISKVIYLNPADFQ